MSITSVDPAPWAELDIHAWGKDGAHNGSITSFDGERHYTIADIEADGRVRVKDYESYPAAVQPLFPACMPRQARLMALTAFFDDVVTGMRALTRELGYPEHTWAAAMVLRQESCLMQAVHGPTYADFTYETCLQLVSQFRPAYTYQQLGILIDHNMDPAVLLGYDGSIPYGFLTELYATQSD